MSLEAGRFFPPIPIFRDFARDYEPNLFEKIRPKKTFSLINFDLFISQRTGRKWAHNVIVQPASIAKGCLARPPAIPDPLRDDFMSLYTRLFTLLHGRLVGTDSAGNRYYEQRGVGVESHPDLGASKQRRRRRWVVYNGEAEASRVPSEWHAWLHYTVKLPPDPEVVAKRRRFWQKEHRPNATGTPGAYLPPGHSLAGGRRDKATGDYEAWTPPG